MKKQGAGFRLPVSCVLAMFSGLVLESAVWGAVPVSVSLSKGIPSFPLTNRLVAHADGLGQGLLGQSLLGAQGPDEPAGFGLVNVFHLLKTG